MMIVKLERRVAELELEVLSLRWGKASRVPDNDPGFSHRGTPRGVGSAPDPLRDSSLNYRMVATATRDALWDWDVATGRTLHNDGWYELLGLGSGQVPGTFDGFAKMIHPDDIADVGRRLDAMISGTSATYLSEHRMRRGDGYIWVRDRGAIVERNADGKPKRVVGRFEDITEQKLADLASAQSRKDLDVAQRIARIGSYVVDFRSGTWSGSAALNDVLGVDDSFDSSLDAWLTLVHPEDRARMDAVNVKFSADGGDFQNEYRIVRPVDGRSCWVLAAGECERDARGVPILLYGTIQNIQERKEVEEELRQHRDGLAELVEQQTAKIQASLWVTQQALADLAKQNEALRESENRFRTTTDNASVLLWIADADRQCRYFNKPWLDFAGRTLEQESGDGWLAGVHPDDMQHVRDTFDAAFAAREPFIVEYRHRRADGQYRWLTARGAPRFTDDGNYVGFSGSSMDITDRRQTEEAALAASQAKSEFLANMSHEIRTPMNAIIGLSHLVLRTPLERKQRDDLKKIHSSAQSLLRIVNEVLDFSKIDAGKMELETLPFGMDEVVVRLSAMVADQARQKRLEFQIEIAPEVPPSLLGDPGRLGQVLINLLSNAIKFTPKGEVTLAVTVGARDEGRVQIRFCVQDQGIGMTGEQVGLLFNSFTQADNSVTRKYGGTGLGLVIARNLVALMGGSLGVSSELGVGTHFEFALWFDIGDDTAAASDNGRFVDGRALVVDDNPIARAVHANLLKRFGLRVSVVASGAAALAELLASDASDPYRMVFMDWQLPGEDGVDLTHAIRHELALSHRPAVVMVTARDAEEVAVVAQAAGAHATLEKPVNQSTLWDVVAEIHGLSGERRGRERAMSDPDVGSALEGVAALVVEDNAINQQIITELLQIVGVRVTLAQNGLEALELLRNAPDPVPWSIVLMDIQMPVMDGHDATMQIRADARFDGLPIVAMTAHAMQEERDRCKREGMNDHVTKPIDPSTLYRCVQRWARPASTERVPEPVVEVGKLDLEIEGLNVRLGVARVAGKPKLYLALLGQFAANFANWQANMQAALETERWHDAERQAHTLKGVAANIGAEQVAELSAALELACRQQHPQAVLLARLATMTEPLAALLANIELALAARVRSEAPPADVNPQALAALLARLDALIAASDAAALRVFDENESLLRTGLGAAYVAIATQLHNFDFDEARAAILACSPVARPPALSAQSV